MLVIIKWKDFLDFLYLEEFDFQGIYLKWMIPSFFPPSSFSFPFLKTWFMITGLSLYIHRHHLVQTSDVLLWSELVGLWGLIRILYWSNLNYRGCWIRHPAKQYWKSLKNKFLSFKLFHHIIHQQNKDSPLIPWHLAN